MSVTCKAARVQAAVIIAIALAGPQPIVTSISPVNAAAAGCDQIVQKVQNHAAKIVGLAEEYFTHRKNYVDLLFGRSRLVVKDWKKAAEGEKSRAGPAKLSVPATLGTFRADLQSAHAKNCLNAKDLQMIQETVTDYARRVNFDQFPPPELEAQGK